MKLFIFILHFFLIFINSKVEYSDAHHIILQDKQSTIDGIELISQMPIFGVKNKDNVVSIVEQGTYIVSGILNGKLSIETKEEGITIYRD